MDAARTGRAGGLRMRREADAVDDALALALDAERGRDEVVLFDVDVIFAVIENECGGIGSCSSSSPRDWKFFLLTLLFLRLRLIVPIQPDALPLIALAAPFSPFASALAFPFTIGGALTALPFGCAEAEEGGAGSGIGTPTSRRRRRSIALGGQ